MKARTWKGFGILATILVVVGLVSVVAARLWVGSEHGRRTIERKIDESLAAHVTGARGGHVRIGRISGSLVGGATLDTVEWRDARGAVALRAHRVLARWSAARALARRPAIELRVEAPYVDVEQLAADVDLDEAMRWLARDAERVEAVTVSRLEVFDATVRIGGVVVGGISATGGVAWQRADGRLALDRLVTRVGGSSATLNGTLTRDAVDLRLASLRIAPEDLRRLSPRAQTPRKPIVGEARLHGRLGYAMLLGELRPDRGRILIGGSVDLERRRLTLRAALDDAEADYTPAVLAGTVHVRAAVVDGTLALEWHADGHYFRRELDPNVPLAVGRARNFAAVRAGGRFRGDGRLVAHLVGGAPAARMRFVLDVDDPGQAARLLAGPDLRNAARPLSIHGDWRLPPRAPATLTLHR